MEEKDKDKFTPLHYAAMCGQTKICEILISAGANVNALTKNDNYTPLMFAVRSGSKETCNLLIKSGANVNIVVLIDMIEVKQHLFLQHGMGSNEICELLLNAGSVKTTCCRGMKTAIDFAMDEGHKNTATFLELYFYSIKSHLTKNESE